MPTTTLTLVSVIFVVIITTQGLVRQRIVLALSVSSPSLTGQSLVVVLVWVAAVRSTWEFILQRINSWQLTCSGNRDVLQANCLLELSHLLQHSVKDSIETTCRTRVEVS